MIVRFLTVTRATIVAGLIASGIHAQDRTPARIAAIHDYPPLARMARAEGDVVVKCTLRKDGSVAKAEAVSGPALLKEQAQTNALLWKFQRSLSAATASEVSVTLTYQYRMDGERPDNWVTAFSVDLPYVVHIIAPAPYVMQ